MVECQLPKLKVASSILVARSTTPQKKLGQLRTKGVHLKRIAEKAIAVNEPQERVLCNPKTAIKFAPRTLSVQVVYST